MPRLADNPDTCCLVVSRRAGRGQEDFFACAARRCRLCALHLGDARLPGGHGLRRCVERPVTLVLLALAEPHHREHAGERCLELLEHVGDPFGLAAALFGARDFGDEERLVDISKRIVGLLEHLRERLPPGPALARAPVVAVDGDVVHVLVARVVARERGTAALVRRVGRPYPLDVGDALFAENAYDVAEGLGDVCVGVAGTGFPYPPVVPVTVCFVERPHPDLVAEALHAFCKFADVAVRFPVHDVLRAVAVRHPGHHQRGAVFLRDIGVLLHIVPVVYVEQCKVADEVDVVALHLLESLDVFAGRLRVLAGPADPCTDLES